MTRNTCILLFFMVCYSFLGLAQRTNFPEISIPNEKDEPIELSDLHISVYVIENIATTTFEMKFYNPNRRVMEGELNFPLSNGTSISRFALEVNGAMREGVVVDKQKATQVFEAITRRNVDPGLAQVTKGNNFKARVYPIPANGYKRVIVAFEEELRSDDKSFLYQLPLNFKKNLNRFSVKVESILNEPRVFENENPTINLKFLNNRNSFISEHEENNVKLNSQLAFAIPKRKQVRKTISYKGKLSSDNYFYVNVPITPEIRVKNKPTRIALVWDASSSAKNRELEKEITFLKSYFEWMQNGTIELVTFSNKVHAVKAYELLNGKQPELIEHLKSIKSDGGTNLGAVDFSTLAGDEILLFTDAISNFGEKSTYLVNAPILAVNSSNICDHAILEHLASASGGSYLNALELSMTELISKASHVQKQFIKAEYSQIKLKDVYPKPGIKVDNNFNCSGIIEGPSAEIQLHFGFGNEITETHELKIENTEGIENSVGERIWAQKKLKSLLAIADASQIRSHGKQFNLVTPNTSLLVLDEIADYVRYEVTPPISMQDEYFNLINVRDKRRANDKARRISALCNQFEQEYKEWNKTAELNKLKSIQKSNELSLFDMQSESAESIVESDQTVRGSRSGSSVSFIDEVRVAGNSLPNSLNKDKKGSRTAKVTIRAWESNASYINSLKMVSEDSLYGSYLKLREKQADNPSFYFDVATYLFQRNKREEGLRVISNLAELELENTELLRTLGRKLSEFKFHKEALSIFKEVLELRSFEPHSYIDLGLTYEELDEHQLAIDNLYTVIDKEWDADILSRFSGIELIVLHDINSILNQANGELNLDFIEPCLLKNTPVDIRIVLDWDANETDIDLWITDPTMEKCSYSNKRTRIGGIMSNDMIQGYGPEEFRLKHAIEGKYLVEAKFYGSRKQTLLGKVSVQAFVYTNFGKENETKQVLTIQLKPKKKGEYVIGEITF